VKSTILTVGLNHTTAPIHVREQIASARCLRDEAQAILFDHLDPALFSEVLILSTCNRTEIYAVTSNRPRAEEMLRAVFALHEAFPLAGTDYVYAYAGRDAVAHLFAVASGIDSMLLGEFEILGQIRSAYQTAAEKRALGSVLHQLFRQALSVGKRARSETAIGAGATSVAYAAVALARQQLGDLKGRAALVVGAGEMGRRAARNLAEDGACTVIVASRTYTHAAELASEIGSRAIAFDELPDVLAQVELVISATKAPHLILDARQVAEAMRRRPDWPLCLIDIAVPRDIDPAVAQLENVRLHNIDDLQALVETNRSAREEAVADVHAIIAEEVREFWDWYMSRRAAPLLSELHTRAEAIRQAELEKTLRRLDHLNLNERDRAALEALSLGIVKKMLAAPRSNLKARMQSGDGQVYLDVLRELFDLEQTQSEDGL
jgi:glutamyl-tRNA reductase